MSFKTKAIRFAAKQVFLLKKESPTILFATGVICVGSSTVLACKATMKVPPILEIAEKNLMAIDQLSAASEDYVKNHRRAELAKHKAAMVREFILIYAPAAGLMVVGIAALGGSHYLLNKRNAALGAALTALEQTHREYRRRVAQDVGKEREKELHYEAQKAALHEKNQDGTPSKTRRKSSRDSSIYARFFDQLNPNWDKQPEYNKMFLHAQQEYATNRLNARGFMFLNEVYKELGIPYSKAGNVVGWIVTDDDTSDNFVDFGIFDGSSRELRAFVNGDEGSILLDFNVAGNILDRVKFKNE